MQTGAQAGNTSTGSSIVMHGYKFLNMRGLEHRHGPELYVPCRIGDRPSRHRLMAAGWQETCPLHGKPEMRRARNASTGSWNPDC
eukprot:15260005-Heterocapsa_arctica.AAC.1